MIYIDPDTGASMASVDIGEQRWVRSPAMLFSGEIRLSPISQEHHADNVATGVGDVDTPLAFRIHGAIPNPFNPMTTIRFELAHSTGVDLDVYNLSGRLIRRLVAHERMDGGVQDRVWNGTDKNGLVVPIGVYICRMMAGGHQAARPFIDFFYPLMISSELPDQCLEHPPDPQQSHGPGLELESRRVMGHRDAHQPFDDQGIDGVLQPWCDP